MKHSLHKQAFLGCGEVHWRADRPNEVFVVSYRRHYKLLSLAPSWSITFYCLVKDKRALLSFSEGFALILCGFRQYLPNISTVKTDTTIHVAET